MFRFGKLPDKVVVIMIRFLKPGQPIAMQRCPKRLNFDFKLLQFLKHREPAGGDHPILIAFMTLTKQKCFRFTA
jgi:hypothetical protein